MQSRHRLTTGDATTYWAEACKAPGQERPGDEAPDPQFGDAALQTRRDAFTTLARSIVGQRSSVKAAANRWGTLYPRCREP